MKGTLQMNAPRYVEPAPESQSGGSSADLSWSYLVEQVRAGEPGGLEELYRIFSKGIRFHLCRHLGPQDLDDKMHDVFLIITQSIQRGELREPERLMGYVRTIVRRQVAAHIDHAVQARRNYTELDSEAVLSDHHPDPERRAIERENNQLAMRILNSIPKRDREVLVRFYLLEQAPGQICREMDFTETQFRLIKSRAKARFGELGRARLSRREGFRVG
jgi:RNA polymerase sigma-70 factor, ECF subfamily